MSYTRLGYNGPMSEGPTNQPDGQMELLREIKDLLKEQIRQNDEQLQYDKERWEAQLRDNRQFKFGCLTTIATLIVILLLILLGNLISN